MGNREDLLRGTLECLLDKGYAGTTARDITARSGTSLAAIGYHFDSTEQLLHEVIAQGFRKWRGELTTILSQNAGRPPDDLVAAVGDELTRLFKSGRQLFSVFLEALALTDRSDLIQQQASATYREDRAGVASMLRAIRGEPHADDVTLASALLAVVDGLVIQHLISPEDAPSPRAVLELLAPVIRGGANQRRARPKGRR